jgi:hypothetical protein
VALITRSLSISYGALAFGAAASGYAIDGPVSPSFGYRSVAFSFSVVVHGLNASDLETKSAALIAQIRTPRQDLVVTFGTRVHSFKQSDKTGWDHEGSIEPDDASIFNTHTTREYTISIQVTTPATLAGDDGVSNYGYSHSIGSDGKRRFSVTGVITTDGSTDAEAQYVAKIAAIVSSIQSDIDGSASWTEIQEDRGIERFDFEMTFSRSYVERIFKDSLSADDVASIKEPEITIIPSLIFDANATPDIKRPIETVISYSAFIDKQVTVDLIAIWNEHVVPLIKDLAQTYASLIFGNDQTTVQEITPTFSPTGNTVSGIIRFVSFGAQKILAVAVEETITATSGVIKVGVYGTSPYQRARLPGQATAKATLISTVTVQGSRGEALSIARGFAKEPLAKRPPGEILKFPVYKLLTRNDASKTGGTGGGWSLDSETQQYIGPLYTGQPPLPVTTCVLTRVFDYDEEANLNALRIPNNTKRIVTRARKPS